MVFGWSKYISKESFPDFKVTLFVLFLSVCRRCNCLYFLRVCPQPRVLHEQQLQQRLPVDVTNSFPPLAA